MSDGWKRLWSPPRRGCPKRVLIDGEYCEQPDAKSLSYAARSQQRFNQRTDEQNERDNIFYGNIIPDEIGRCENVRFVQI